MDEIEFLKHIGYELDYDGIDIVSVIKGNSCIQYHKIDEFFNVVEYGDVYHFYDFNILIRNLHSSEEEFKLWKRSRTINKILK